MKFDKSILDCANKKVLVVGLGISGFWAARWLAGKGAEVTVSDIRPESDINQEFYKELVGLGVKMETGKHERESFLKAQMIVVSPGVPYELEQIKVSAELGIPIIGELELASLLIDIPLLAITGTNGKSTVTAMLGSVIQNSGHGVFVGGNIGTPLMAYVDQSLTAEYAVVEVSSFQLDTIESFCPFVSVILNISPDHLDRYPDYISYVNSKLKVFQNQGAGQYLIINDDDEILSRIRPNSAVTVLRYGIENRDCRNAFVENNEIKAELKDKAAINIPLDMVNLPGRHNIGNIMAVILCSLVTGIENSAIIKTINEFRCLPNRLEWVDELAGVSFVNDSKATNVDAAVKSVNSFNRPLILIAGGLHKGSDYNSLVKAAVGKVKHCVFIGKAKGLLARAFEGLIPFDIADDMDEAVSTAFSRSTMGDIVLLAPACSSFDMYKDYSHRGSVFRAAVERLSRG